MAKSKFFRVAVEGATVDGRQIERAHIEQMAATYDPATYTARVNCEHLRGYSPVPPFNAYGSVAEVRTEEITLKLGGKDEKRLALFASFEVNDQAKELTKADQKVFSSVEINPNFAGTGKAYLVGLALTDSPASLGTELLKFSTREDARKDNLIALADAFAIEFEDSAGRAADHSEVTGAFAAMRNFFSQLAAPKEPEAAPAAPPAAGAESDQIAAFASGMAEHFAKLETALNANNAAFAVKVGKLGEDMAALQAAIEQQPSKTYTQRPAGTGGADATRS